MTWIVLREILLAEVPDRAAALETAIRAGLGGFRVSIPQVARAVPLTQDQIRAELAKHGWRVSETARALNVHPTTIYRSMRPKRRSTAQVLLDPITGRILR